MKKIKIQDNEEKDEAAKKISKHYQENKTEFDFTRATSFNECTGLIPTPPNDDEEYESYLEIFDYGPQVEENTGETEAIE